MGGFGCAGHGKGAWDGLGAVIKQMVRRDILHNNILTSSGYITSPAEVADVFGGSGEVPCGFGSGLGAHVWGN